MAAGNEGRGTIHVNQPLTNVAIEYRNQDYIADQILPIVPVPKQSDKYYVFGKENFRIENDQRADKSPSVRMNSYSVSDGTFFCNKHAGHDLISDGERSNADAVIQPDIRVTTRLMDKLLLSREATVSAYLFNGTTFSGYTATAAGLSGGAGAQWSDYTNSDPAKDMDVMKALIRKTSGIEANTVVMGREVFDKVKRHPDVIDVFKCTSGGVITPAMLSEYFQIPKIIVGSTTYNSAAEGATETMAYLWGKYVLLGYVAPSASINTPSLGYIFSWQLYNGLTGKVKKWRKEELDSDVIEVEMAYDPIVTAASAGYLLTSVIA